jgi:hypothetical protein
LSGGVAVRLDVLSGRSRGIIAAGFVDELIDLERV